MNRAETVIFTLESRIKELESQLREARSTIEPFVEYLNWVEAAKKMGEIDNVHDHTCFAFLSVAGGSMGLHIAELKKLAEVYKCL